jgi:argininosuccinate lyase
MKLWSGRFTENTNELTDKYNASIPFDYKLAKYDIIGTKAHVKGLLKAGVLKDSEFGLIINALDEVNKQINDNEYVFKISDEDIHMSIESSVINIIGDVGKKMHTGRSRNDQVAVDTRLYTIDMLDEINKQVEQFITILETKKAQYKASIMPGVTHLQLAQPITIGFFIDTYICMFKRDVTRIEELKKRINICPLGSGALSGTSYSIDRFFVAQELGFDAPCSNAMDGVSDRDYIIETIQLISIIGVHISKLCEEIIIFNSQIYDYVTIGDQFATGSSIMPQKKNPDIAELARGKCARLIGNEVQILTLIKATPLAYNKDFQEDKVCLFDSVETIIDTLEIVGLMMDSIIFNCDKMYQDCKKGFINATDLADYLVAKDIPFRDAHHIVGKIVSYAQEHSITLDDISIDIFHSFCESITTDVYEFIKIENCVKRKTSYGGVGNYME